jgi:hypothetical protein
MGSCVRIAAIGHNRCMGNPLIDLIVAILAICGAIVAVGMLGRGRLGSLYDHIGREGDYSSPAPRPEPHAGSPAAFAERDLEVRQMLQARNERRARSGEAPLDLDAELARLIDAPPGVPAGAESGQAQTARHDPELVEELRQLAEARNQRRIRRGEPPLDVRAEVERALAELDV